MTNYEREIIRALDATGWPCMRCPSSGAATGRALPDVRIDRRDVVMDTQRGELVRTESWAIEHKYTSTDIAYVEESEVDALKTYAHASGATPLLGARFSGDRTHYCVEPIHCRTTPEGNYAIDHATAESKATLIVHARGTGQDPDPPEVIRA